MPAGGLTARSFGRAEVVDLLGDGASVEYLVEYLAALGATSFACELHYVDRHYLDDFVRYYARSFRAPSPHAARLHFFRDLDASDLDGALDRGLMGERERDEVEALLQRKYLGFVVRRPLDGPAMGRTVLRTYPVDGRRHYTVVRPYRVHLAGLHLTVDGLAYQQQDGGAAVCASTALWSALQRIAHVSGHRTPTPSQITDAARSPYPASHGLNAIQMASALSSLGYIADEFAAGPNQSLFCAQLVCCLESQLPVVLLLERIGTDGSPQGHAVTVTGYSEPAKPGSVVIQAPEAPLLIRGSAVSVIYVHDDNLGSHAHYELVQGGPKLLLWRGRRVSGARPWWTPDEWSVTAALVPKPEKLRLPIEGLFSAMIAARVVLERVVLPQLRVSYAPRFCAGVDYVRQAVAMPLDPAERASFFRSLSLPRHVAVISVHLDSMHVLDVVLDASAMVQGLSLAPLMAFVAPAVQRGSLAARGLEQVAQHFNVPFITGA